MVEETNSVPQEAVRQRAIDFIQKKWGNLGDLPKPLIPVVWVTVYRSIRTVMAVEAEGGSRALLKNTLIGDRRLMPDFQETTIRIEFLQKMIPLIRSHPSQVQRLADAQVAIDFLKYNMDVASLSRVRRAIIRQFAKTAPEYERPIPPEIS
jgi:hypothetical protein